MIAYENRRTPDNRELVVDALLQGIAEELDIPPGKYEEAVERYTAVGRWLEGGTYPGATGVPRVYPQGSFRLGTVVRPLRKGEEREYDIDLACELDMSISATAPRDLKHIIGDRLKENTKYERMLEQEGRRCWTLIYAEDDGAGFHLDVLPCIPNGSILAGVDPRYAMQAIEITDRKGNATYAWGKSNPNGFADWFLDRQRVAFLRVAAARKAVILERYGRVYARVDDVPDQLVRTPLQRMVQVLKRHRDVRFSGHPDEADAPISIIITTLAALAYDQEPDVFAAMASFLDKVTRWQDSGLIKCDGERWVIENPVNPGENFADRWNDGGSRKPEAFFQWAQWVQEDMDELLNASTRPEVDSILRRAFGDTPGGKIAARYEGAMPGEHQQPRSSFGRRVKQLMRFDVEHKLPLRWRMAPRRYAVRVNARYDRRGWRPAPFFSNSPPLPKGASLVFEVHTNVPKPFEVYWQVVNTGEEAARAGQLRGKFYDSNKSGRTHQESTQYSGMHWIEAFVVKDDVCVARSGEFVVNIA